MPVYRTPADPLAARLDPRQWGNGDSDCLADVPLWTDLYATARATVSTLEAIVDEVKLTRAQKATLTYTIELLETACDEYNGAFRGRLLLPGMTEYLRGWRPRRYVNGPTS